MSRKAARENAFKLVYEYCIAGERNELTLAELSQGFAADDAQYISAVYDGITSQFDTLSKEIETLSSGFSLSRIYKVDLSILLIALFEMRYLSDVPPLVSVNEAVELAKKYSTDKSFSFINGILATLVKQLPKPQEDGIL